MITVSGLLLDSWQELIDGVISVPVYKEGSVPEDAVNYVELRVESEFENDTKETFVSDVIVITDIVTVFHVAIDRSVVESIDNQIKVLIKSTPGIIGLQNQTGIQILNVVPETTSFLTEYDAGKKYYRKIVRYKNRIIQTL